LLCGNKFDLDKWDPEYFKRLKDFITWAGERGIVVEICFFNSQYSDTWPISPLYYENNVQGVGKCDYLDAQTMKYPDLVRRMDDYVSKITQEVNAFDNVILEICDEPSLFTPHAEAGPWVAHFVPVIKKAESNLPKKHLLAQQARDFIRPDLSHKILLRTPKSAAGYFCNSVSRSLSNCPRTVPS